MSPMLLFVCFAIGLLQIVKRYVKIPIYAMIRPRGGDFLYTDQEVEVMRKDIELMKSHGADGLVLGALTEDGRVDTELCMELLGIVCQYIWCELYEYFVKLQCTVANTTTVQMNMWQPTRPPPPQDTQDHRCFGCTFPSKSSKVNWQSANQKGPAEHDGRMHLLHHLFQRVNSFFLM